MNSLRISIVNLLAVLSFPFFVSDSETVAQTINPRPGNQQRNNDRANVTGTLTAAKTRKDVSNREVYQLIVRNGVGMAKYDYAKDRGAASVPILYFHGTSSTKLEPLIVLDQIQQKARTVVAFDRPGYGHSKFVRFHSLNDFVPWSQSHLIPAVEEALGYQPKQFDLVSVSGGALFSLRLAQAIPERVRKVTILSAGLFGRPVGREGNYEKLRRFAARRPKLASVVARFGNRHLDFAQSVSARNFSAPDKRFAACHKELAGEIFVDATRCGVNGIVQDARLQLADTSYASPLDSKIKVEYWNGTCDNTVSVESAKLLACKLNVDLQLVSNEGHLSSIPFGFRSGVIDHNLSSDKPEIP